MTDFKQVLEKEVGRTTPDQIRTIYLYPEGNFMRAFERSAYLWCKYVKEFKAIRRKVKDTGDIVVQIGCPAASLTNHLPEGASLEQNEDDTVAITLPETMVDLQPDVIDTLFDEWKETLPLAENAKKKVDAASSPKDSMSSRPATLTGIMQQILAFPLDKKSMMDCVTFISDLKTQLARII